MAPNYRYLTLLHPMYQMKSTLLEKKKERNMIIAFLIMLKLSHFLTVK